MKSPVKVIVPLVPIGIFGGAVGPFWTNATLPVYELNKSFIKAKPNKKHPKRIRPLDLIHGFRHDPMKWGPAPPLHKPLDFSLWDLAHAVKKAELLLNTTKTALDYLSVAFLLEHGHDFDPTAKYFSLHVGKAAAYADFVASGLAGRIGQGLVFLFMERQKFIYGEHLQSLIKRAAGTTGSAWATKVATLSKYKKPRKSPDFVFESAAGSTALVESKGCFIKPAPKGKSNSANVTGNLRDALVQLGTWGKHIKPTPSAEYAVASYIREVGDQTIEPSYIAFTDPVEIEPDPDAEELLPDEVRRGHYSAWLRGMGLATEARALLERRSLPGDHSTTLPVVTVADEKYLFIPEYAVMAPGDNPRTTRPPNGATTLRDLTSGANASSIGGSGIRLRVAEAVFRALRQGEKSELRRVEPDIPTGVDSSDDFQGSVTADGTLFGELPADSPILLRRFPQS